ncbi:MAG: NAD(P)H-dependent oxidoreductase [Acidobacteriota bacterium]
MNEKELENIRIVVIQGSVRPGNFTGKAAALLIDELRKAEVHVQAIDPAELNLPPPGLDAGASGPKALRKTVGEATGVIFATPEYHGSFSSVIKLIIENLGFPSVLAGKPVALMGVAAGRIGAIKSLEHLRGVCSHVGALVLPSLVSVANVQKVFDAEGRCLDPAVENQIRGVATGLPDYIRGSICPRVALERMVRES